MPTLEITTTIGCPLMCTFCPQDALKRAYGRDEEKRIMSLADFVVMLSTVPEYVRVDFSGMSEPWANPECTAMLGHALTKGHNVAIYTTLVGMTDHEVVVGWLRDYHRQVEALVIHLPDASDNMRGFRWSEQWADALRAIVDFNGYQRLRKFELMAMGKTGAVPYGTAAVDPWSGNDRAGSLDLSKVDTAMVERTKPHRDAVSCSFTPFYDQNVVLPNGDVVLCCMDYGLEHKIGNLLSGDYWSLFTSAEMIRLRLENMRCGGGTICKQCVRATRYRLPVEHYRQFWEAGRRPPPADGGDEA